MFRNIGGKIKVFVIVAAILGIITCIAYGAIIITYSALGEKMPEFLVTIGLDKAVSAITAGKTGVLGIISGAVTAVAGSFIIYLAAFIPYGLGQLIQNSDRTVKNLENIKASLADIRRNQANGNFNSGTVPYPVFIDEYGRPFYYINEDVGYNEEQVNDGDLVPGQSDFSDAPSEDAAKDENEKTATEETDAVSENNDKTSGKSSNEASDDGEADSKAEGVPVEKSADERSADEIMQELINHEKGKKSKKAKNKHTK